MLAHIKHTERKATKPSVANTTFFGGRGSRPFFQPKLTVNQPGDAHEQEADRVADQVMRIKEGDSPILQSMPLTPVGKVMRMCDQCAEEKKDGVQRKETRSGDASGKAAPSMVGEVLSSNDGRPMEGGTRQFMESRFGRDFSQVRIHTGSKAAESAQAIQAKAYTSGRDVVFGAGEFQPSSSAGKRLLAHELAHVGQQEGGQQTADSVNTGVQLKKPSIQRQDGVVQRITEDERYDNTLSSAGTTRTAWDGGYIGRASFLGVRIGNGIHQELADRLVLAEAYLRGLFPSKTDAEIAAEIGLYSISGKRAIKNAVGGSKLSFHSFGLAIDVNYKGNPFIGRSGEVDEIINRIFQFMTGNEFHIATRQSGTIEEIRIRFTEASRAFVNYFGMRGDRGLIRAHLASKGQIRGLSPGETVNPMQAEDDRRVQEVFDQIEMDATSGHLVADMKMTNGGGDRALTDGFIDLSEALVEALTHQAGLYWGAQYNEGKDIMHFDWRRGTIRDSDRK